jgi:uncharacterized membrane protein YedE/YeeE
MKYLLYIPFGIMILAALLTGVFYYLWKFSSKDFHYGTQRLNKYTKFFDVAEKLELI